MNAEQFEKTWKLLSAREKIGVLIMASTFNRNFKMDFQNGPSQGRLSNLVAAFVLVFGLVCFFKGLLDVVKFLKSLF